MGDYFIKHYNYIQTLSYEDIEKSAIEWNPFRVEPNYKDRILKYNPPLTPEEFEIEMNSDYNIKKYMYNFRTEKELKDETLKKTYANLLLQREIKEHRKTVRKEHLNWDVLTSNEKQELKHKIYMQLNLLGEVADDREDFFDQKEVI